MVRTVEHVKLIIWRFGLMGTHPKKFTPQSNLKLLADSEPIIIAVNLLFWDWPGSIPKKFMLWLTPILKLLADFELIIFLFY